VKANGRDLLSEIASRHGARSRAANLWVRGVSESFDRRCTLTIEGARVDVFANAAQLYLQVRCESRVLFSTPGSDPTINVRQLIGQVAGHDVFVSELGIGSPVPWIYSPGAVQGLESLALHDGELLTATIGGLSVLLDVGDETATIARLDRIIAFAHALPAAEATEPSMNPQELPADLRGLVDLVETWGQSDDLERSEQIEQADVAALEDLVRQGRPHLARIAELLRAPGIAGDSPEVGRLDAFAQAVMEAEQELRRRKKGITD
jgi:hypothetical protein